MSNSPKYTKSSIILIVSMILFTFIVPILLLSQVIIVVPNAKFAHSLLYISIPITIGTLLFQLLFFKYKVKNILKTEDSEEKKQKLYQLFFHRLLVTLIAVIPNFVFLSLTNFDMFLVINIVLLLWMINIFPFSEKVNHIIEENTKKRL